MRQNHLQVSIPLQCMEMETTEQMVGSVMNTVNQVSDGIKGSTGIDLKEILSNYINGKEEVENEKTEESEDTEESFKEVE